MTETQINARASRSNARAQSTGLPQRWAQSLWARWSAAKFFDPPPRREWSVALRRTRAIGLLVLAIELVIFCWWSSMMVDRFALTTDFAAYYQPTYLIAHGHLNPYSSLWNFSFWHNDGEFIFWLLAIPVRLWPHFETLKWMQALAMVASQAIAFGWICEVAATHESDRRESVAPIVLTALGLLMLIANPWFIWSTSFDVHSEVFAVPFVVAVARDSYRGRTGRAWVWAVLAIVCGAVSATYVAAVGLSLVLCGRRWWRQGVALAIAGIAWQMVLRGIGATGGSNVVSLYWQFFITKQHTLPSHASLPGLVVAVLKHPSSAITTVWGNRANIWATISPSGLIGVAWLPALVPTVLVLAEGALVRYIGFSLPSFQNIVIAPLIAVGTVVLMLKLFARLRYSRRWVGFLCTLVLAINAAMWGIVWFPHVGKTWLLVPKSSAHVLSRVRHEIAPDDQVIASQGVVGGFGDRKYVYNVLTFTSSFPVNSRRVWIVLTPQIGIETAPVGESAAVIGNLLRLPGMRLMVDRDGVWALRWDVPAGVTKLSITPSSVRTVSGVQGGGSAGAAASSPTGTSSEQPNTQASSGAVIGSRAWLAALALAPVPPTFYSVQAWTAPGPAGRVVRTGRIGDWHVVNNGRAGYVVDGVYWQEPAGRYTATVNLSAGEAANIEAWDVTAKKLLLRRIVRRTDGQSAVHLTIDIAKLTTFKIYKGWGLWQMLPVPATRGDTIEVRVWTRAGAGQVKVFELSLR